MTGVEGVRELVEQLQQKLDEVADAAEEFAESDYQRGADEGHQDGLNDARRFLAEYRELAAKHPGCDPDYLEGLDDAMSHLEENGAVDATESVNGDASKDQADAGSESTPAPPVGANAHDDVAEA